MDSLKPVIIDMCEFPLSGDQDTRVTFCKKDIREDSERSTMYTHCPLSVAMHIVSFHQAIPDGCVNSYSINPEKKDEKGHEE